MADSKLNTVDNCLFLDHVLKRMGPLYHCISTRLWFDFNEQLLSFPMYNLSGQLQGYQRYNYKAEKKKRNEGKYYSYTSANSMFGLEFLDYSVPVLFVTEGVFDACTLMHFGNAVAVLCNNPKQLKQQLSLLPFYTVAVCDGDSAGFKLRNYTNDYIILPENEDVNSIMTTKGLSAVKELLGKYAGETRTWFYHMNQIVQ